MSRNVPNFLSQHQKVFIKKLDEVSRKEGHSRAEVFRLFLSMAYNAIKKTTVIGAKADECERDYMEVIARLRRDKSASAKLLAECHGIMVLALEEKLHDFLGPIFMETVSDPAKGQFFTPDELTRLMAEITLGDLIEKFDTEDYVTAQEPAGGTGGAVIAACNMLKERGIDFSRRMVWQVIELDRNAYMGCYVQLSMAGVNAEIINGNTLTLQTFDGAITPVRLLHFRPLHRKPAIKVRKRTRPVRGVPRKRTRPISGPRK